VDTRLVPAAAAAWAGAWLGTADAPGLPVRVGTATVLSLLVAVLGWSWARVRHGIRAPAAPALAVAAMVAVCAAIAGHGRVVALQQGPVDDLARAGASAQLVLRITDDPLPRARPADAPAWQDDQVRVGARVVEVDAPVLDGPVLTSAPIVLLAPRSWLDLRPGAVLAADARLWTPQRVGPVAAVAAVTADPVLLDERPDAFAWASPMREGLREAVRGLPAGPAGLLPSLVTGDETLLSEQVRDDLRVTGLAHLTAVSGANVAIVLGAVLWTARGLGARGRLLPLLGLLAVGGFVLLARPEPSVVRAAAMGVVMVLGLVGGSRGRGIAPLAVAVVGVLLVDPWLARSVGFALSCLATGGIVVLARPWAARAATWMPAPLAAALAVPLAAQLACTPLLVWMTGQLSLSALPANLLAVVAVPPATILGIVVALVGVVSPPLAHVVAAAAMLPSGWIVLVAERGADLPGTALPWQWGVPLAAVVSAVVLGLTPVMLGSRTLSVLLCIALAVVLVRPGPVQGWPPPDWLLVACDVGQGDAVVLNAGEQQAVVVDTGPTPEGIDRCLDDLDVQAVPLLVLTHFHADHVAGVDGVGRGRLVGEVLTTVLDEPAEQAAAVRDWAQRRGVSLRRPVAGEAGTVGEVAWSVLWPQRVIRGQGSAANQSSVVLRVEIRGVSALLTGDIEAAAQRAILAAHPVLDVDVLKVPHHGSADQDGDFLTATAPELAVVSVGVDNDYGHPDPDLLASWQARGVPVARTDRDGDVAVTAGTAAPDAAPTMGVVRRGPLTPRSRRHHRSRLPWHARPP
jgi:competence protein ComEC